MKNIFKKTRVFVSYSHKEFDGSAIRVNVSNRKVKVENFCKSLEKYNIDVVWDKDIKLGFDQNRFMKQLENTDFVIILLTADYQDKIIYNRDCGVKYEYNLIKEKYSNENKINTNIIPILFDGFSSKDLVDETLKNLNYKELKDARTNLYNETIVEIVKNILPKQKNEFTIVLNGDYSISNKADTIIFFEHYFASKTLFPPIISFEMPEYDEVISDYERITRDITEKNDATTEDVKELRDTISLLLNVETSLDTLKKATNMFIELYHEGEFNYSCIDSLFMIHFIDTICKINHHTMYKDSVMCHMKDDVNRRFYFYPDDIKWYKEVFKSRDFNNEVVKLPIEQIANDVLPAFINYVINPDVPSRNISDFIISKS